LRNLLNTFILISLIFSFLSCKDTEETKVSKKIESIQIPCDPQENDITNISNIMKELVTEQIECITEDLKFFIEKFKPDGPDLKGKLSKTKLENVILSSKDIDNSIIDYLDIFYQLNHLILGDDIDYISIESVEKISFLVEHFNRHIIEISPLLDFDKDREVYIIHQKKRKKILETTRVLIKPFIEEFSKNKNITNHTINIPKFLNVFRTDKNAKMIDNIKSLLFIKKILIGGDKFTITQKELRSIINNIPRIGQVLYDLIGFSKIIFRNEKNRWEFYEETLYRMEQLIDKSNGEEVELISMKNFYDAINIIAEDADIDFDFYRPVIDEVKLIFTGEAGGFNLRQIYKIIGELNRVVKIGKVHQIAYNQYREDIDSNKPIKNVDFTNPYFTKPEKDIFSQFVSIVKNYRFFRGDLIAPIYSNNYHRSIKGIIEIGIIEYLAEKVFKYFEKKYPCDNISLFPPRVDKKGNPKYTDCNRNTLGKEDYAGNLTQYQIEKIMLDYSDQLMDLKVVLPERHGASAESATLMTNLFQFQSDGDKDGLVNVQEATEFALQVFSLIAIRDDILDIVAKWCPVDDRNRVQVPCFRRYFFDVLKEPLPSASEYNSGLESLGDYFPRLMEYYEDARDRNDFETIYTFIKKLELFTRTCAYDDIPMGKADITSVFGGLFNIESTLIRFDENQNNIMDPNEVENAWGLYRNAIEGLVRKEGESLVKFSKKIFLYLIKYGNIPEKMGIGFIAKLLLVKPKNPADRITIASILRTIRESSDNGLPTAAYCNKYFKQ
jgi:hypothetical protein